MEKWSYFTFLINDRWEGEELVHTMEMVKEHQIF